MHQHAPAPLDLSGTWHLRLDRDNAGEAGHWHAADFAADPAGSPLILPGSVQHQGFGDDVTMDTPWTGLVVDTSFHTDDRYARYREEGNIKVPFWLQPEKYYKGAAWFQRKVTVPAEWAGRPSALVLERVHWESTVWVDGRRIGTDRSLSTAHRFALGELAPGEHVLTLRIDNRMVVDVGPNAHSVSDHTQGNWNGVIGTLRLEAVPAVAVRKVALFPDAAARTVRAKIDLTGGSAGLGRGTVTVNLRRFNVPGAHEPAPASAHFDLEYPEGLSRRGLTSSSGHIDLDILLGHDAGLWDEFNPALYEAVTTVVSTVNGTVHRDEHRTTFGVRTVTARGTHVAVNGRRTFLRGTIESCVFPLTGYPPTDVASWRRVITTCKQFGLNLLRFHSWCPPEAAFIAADELGFYLQVEAPVWANQGTRLGEGAPVDAFIYEESQRIIDAYGNHPSFLLMAHGNEPSGRDKEFLGEWVGYWRRRDRRRLYTSGAGWPAIDENDFDNIPDPRVQRWGEGLSSRINAAVPETETDYSNWVQSREKPIISHEIGQWCAYPDFARASKYTGLMKPRNFEIFADFLANSGLEDQAHEFLMASGRLQTLCYKEEIESALRTPGFAGFQLLALNDFPGQGTSLVGVLDPFWDEKGYVTAREFSRFCSPVVPLARLARRVWQAGETLTADLQVANFSPGAFHGSISWKLLDGQGHPHAQGELPPTAIAIGNDVRHGSISVALPTGNAAQRLTLVVAVSDGQGQRGENDWDVWVFPASAPRKPARREAGSLLVTSDPDLAARRLAQDGTVLLLADPASIENDVQFGFSTVFWNTAWTRNEPPHTLGIVCDPQHPVFDGFPTGNHTDWQWWDLLQGAKPLVLDAVRPALKPLVQPIDTWFTARRLGLLVEARVGNGRLMACSLDLAGDLSGRPAAQHFMRGLVRYLKSPEFEPKVQLEAGQLRPLLNLPQGA
ncbi:glycoside hydrolase [Pseudarthrobacter sp. NPDC058196]|uniref:glycoside hydrolase n=1 Tax=Pseudarthrobacter sp. NPDC058196 TaxID=3346376 RepID=UPI0036D9B08C